MATFLADKGARVLKNGFDILPIKPGEKFPELDGWRTVIATGAVLAGWLKNGHAKDGLGIRTDKTPMIDIDTLDKAVGDELQDWIEINIGYAPVRYGNAPKRGLLFRSEVPFRKMSSREYIDSRGRKAQVEILGEGQQFVAFAVHPETKKPYWWLRDDSPETTTPAELPLLTIEDAQAVLWAFDRIALSHGWRLKDRGSVALAPRSLDPLDEWGLDTAPLGLDEDELRRKVMLIPNDADADVRYEGPGLSWFNVMAAIHHETEGSDVGYEIAWLWSGQSPIHEEEKGRFDKTWRSLGKGEGPQTTARLILMLAREYEQIAIAKQVEGWVDRFNRVMTTEEIRPITAEIRQIQLDELNFGVVVGALKTAFKRITGQILGVKEARDMVRYHPAAGKTPSWLSGSVYLTHIDRFFNIETKQMLTQKAFDNAFSRFLPPDSAVAASRYALNTVKIPVAHMAIYMPTEPITFVMNGRDYVNTYDGSTAAQVPTTLTTKDRKNVERVKSHFAHLFPDPRDVRIFTSYLAHLVQTRQRSNWAVVLQGVEGDGRSFFAHLMAAVLGGPNVYVMEAKTLEAPHNDWAQGHLLTCIEEIRLVGHSRHETLNRIKPLITNSTIEIHPKGLPTYNCPNTSAYLAMTNYRNALPITDNDRRYFIILSRWRDAAALTAFETANPAYYTDLYKSVESAGAIRGYLETYTLDPEFQPQGRAPFSRGREQMAALNKSDESIILAELLAEGSHRDVCNELVIVSALIGLLGNDTAINLGAGQVVKTILSEAGFDSFGRIKIAGEYESIWTRTPEKWSSNLTTRNAEIRKWLEPSI